MTISDIEIFAADEWYSGKYRDVDGQEYDVTLLRSYMHDIGYECWELANIVADVDIDNPDDLWERIGQEVARLDLPDCKPHKRGPDPMDKKEAGG